MKIKLLDKYEATVTRLFSQLPLPPWHPGETINVWLSFDEAVGGCASFPVSIEAKDYTKEEFIEYVRGYAEAALTHLIAKDIEERAMAKKINERRLALNKLTADLGDKLGLAYEFDTR